MKNKQNQEGDVPEVTSLARLERYAVQCLELGQKIFEKLQDVEYFVEMLLRQKARELNPEQPDAETAP